MRGLRGAGTLREGLKGKEEMNVVVILYYEQNHGAILVVLLWYCLMNKTMVPGKFWFYYSCETVYCITILLVLKFSWPHAFVHYTVSQNSSLKIILAQMVLFIDDITIVAKKNPGIMVLFIIQYHNSNSIKISWLHGFVHHTVSQQ